MEANLNFECNGSDANGETLINNCQFCSAPQLIITVCRPRLDRWKHSYFLLQQCGTAWSTPKNMGRAVHQRMDRAKREGSDDDLEMTASNVSAIRVVRLMMSER